MRVERGRGALVAVADPEVAAGDAAQAFERLGAEVKILRRAMESLAAAVVEADAFQNHPCKNQRWTAPWSAGPRLSRKAGGADGDVAPASGERRAHHEPSLLRSHWANCWRNAPIASSAA